MTFERITVDPKRMNGQPCVRQLRLTVRRVVEAVATYPDRRELNREFPEVEEEDILESLAYAASASDFSNRFGKEILKCTKSMKS